MKLITYIIKKRKWKLWPCLFGKHIFDWKEWSRNYQKTHLINFHCRRCQDIIKTLPFDDIPKEQRDHIFYICDNIQVQEKRVDE